jgi:hypothetical protein
MHLMERFICLQAQKIASAGSLFASGCQEIKHHNWRRNFGGYYGHNGHTPLSYKLPKSKLK